MKKQFVPVALGLATACGASELAWSGLPAHAAPHSQIANREPSVTQIPREQTSPSSPASVYEEEISALLNTGMSQAGIGTSPNLK